MTADDWTTLHTMIAALEQNPTTSIPREITPHALLALLTTVDRALANQTTLSPRDQEAFAKAILDPATPAERLQAIKKAVREGRVDIGNPAHHLMHAQGADRSATVSVFDHEERGGMVIHWAERGTGFGEITISGDKDTNEWTVHTEGMGPGWCVHIFRLIEARMKP